VPIGPGCQRNRYCGNQDANWKRPAKAKDIARLRVIRVGADRRNPYRVVVDLENDIPYGHDAARLVVLVVVFRDIITDDIAIPSAASAQHPNQCGGVEAFEEVILPKWSERIGSTFLGY
jgi:hypothetical protein